MTDSYTFGTRGNGLRVSEAELKNQLDRERLRNNPSEFFGTNQFGENSGSSTIENNNNADNAVKDKETNERTQDRYVDANNPQVQNNDSNKKNTKAEEKSDLLSILGDAFKDGLGNTRANTGTVVGRYRQKKRGGVLRYPLEAMTEHTDYLQIDIEKYEPIGSSYVNAPGDDNRYVRGNTFTNRAGRRSATGLSTKPLINDGTILLPVPANLQDTNNVNYGASELNGLQAAGAAGITRFIDPKTGLDVSNLFSAEGRLKEITKAGFNVGALAGDVVSGAGSLDAASNFFRQQVAAAGINMFGGNVTANQLLQRANGEIINPHMELLFNAPTLRNFRFSFRFSPRNEKEAEQVRLILRAFKRNMAPKAQGGNVGSGSWFLKTPNVFNLRYRTGRKNHPFLNRFKQCFLTDMQTTYTGEGIYSTYDDGTPVVMQLDLSFKEIQPIYDVDYDERPGTEAVGY